MLLSPSFKQFPGCTSPFYRGIPRTALGNELHGSSIRGPNGGEERRVFHLMPGLQHQQRRRYLQVHAVNSQKDRDRATAVITDLEKAEPENEKDDITFT
jgi:hypothetical protein